MTTEQTMNQMMELLPFVSNVLDDPELQGLSKRLRKGPNGEPSELDSLQAMNQIFPVMFTKHRNDLYGILGVQLGRTPEQVKDLPFEEVRAVLKSDSMSAFFDFFPFVLQMALHA